MPDKDLDSLVFKYPTPKMGVNLYKNPLELDPKEAIFTQNLIWRNGLVKRGGSNKFEDDEVQTGKAITGLHRFYYSTASKQLIASSGTVVRRHDGATWQDIQTGLTDGNQVHFSTWGGVQKMYFGTGADELYSWDGSSVVTLSGGNIPSSIVQTLPFQDRLLAIDNTNPGTLSWSNSFSDTAANWVPYNTTGVRPDSQLFGMSYHSINNSDSGYETTVLLAGANGMYLFSGTDLRTPATTGNYTIYPLATNIGCNAPRTMAWTPKGTIYLGIDKQVYILPFGSSTPVPIGHKITSFTYLAGIEGIEDTPSGQIENACGVYHDGFYKISVAATSGTTNTIQWWLDVSRLAVDEDGMWGPWYGPMVGNAISVFMVQSGAGDSGELFGGEGNGATGSFIYQLDQKGVFGDNGTDIDLYYQTFYNPLGNENLRSQIHAVEAELLNVLGTVNVEFHDIEGSLKTGDNFALSGHADYWDDHYWDEEYWSSSQPTRVRLDVSPAILPRRLSMIIRHSSNNDKFELYSLRAKAIQENEIFG